MGRILLVLGRKDGTRLVQCLQIEVRSPGAYLVTMRKYVYAPCMKEEISGD